MTIHVRHIDEKTVEVTDGTWDWKATNKRVASAIEREIECTTVEDLPRAEARRV